MYQYKAKVVNVVDGDTADLEFDLGFNIKHTARVRFLDFDAPEITRPKSQEEKEKGLLVKQWCVDNLLGKEFVVDTHKDRTDKYGRYLVDILFRGNRLSAVMRLKGLGKEVNDD